MLTPIYPNIKFDILCPYCRTNVLKNNRVIWQGIHIVSDSSCPNCEQEYLCDLPAGQGLITPYVLNKKTGTIFENKNSYGNWFTTSLKQIIKSPRKEPINFQVEKFKNIKKVIILNSLDFIHGHCIARLFNAEEYLVSGSDYGLILIIQPFLRWMVPIGVAEIWTVSLPMRDALNYYSYINKNINEEMARFDEVLLSSAYIFPDGLDISKFTRISIHDHNSDQFRITFIWREDVRRLWHKRSLLTRGLKKLAMRNLLRFWQILKIKYLFKQLKNKFPNAKFTIAGFGRFGRFPQWIEDHRVNKFNESNERRLCKIYSQSRIVIGVHGSSMILPSVHAGMVISLMPQKRWGNFAQDLVFNENNDRKALFQKRILPIEITIKELVDICEHMLSARGGYLSRMIEPFTSLRKL